MDNVPTMTNEKGRYTSTDSELPGTEAEEFLPTRWSLLTRLKDWDNEGSWREFFDAYWPLIYRTAIKAGLTPSDAEDVVQEVVISVAKKIGEFKTDPESGSFKNWLLNITRWRVMDQLRRRGREEQRRHVRGRDTDRTSTVERVPDPAGAHVDAAWEADWEKNLLQAAMNRAKTQVKPEVFQIFDLLANKGWPGSKIARRLQVSLAQVYYAKQKVSALVRREMRKLTQEGF